MKVAYSTVMGATLLMASSGCSMCKNPYDCAYAAFGGSRPRVDRVHGRVSSRFHDAGPAYEVPPEPTDVASQYADNMASGEVLKPSNDVEIMR